MKKILLLSDSHGYIDKKIIKYFDDIDQVWHAGDIGNIKVCETILKTKPLKAVFGNIDNFEIREKFQEDLNFHCEGLKIYITHIGGYPGNYNKRVKKVIEETRPNVFICGHSHILKVIYDKKELSLPQNEKYFLLNKPMGFICSRLNSQERKLGKKSIYVLFYGKVPTVVYESLITVGR